MVTPCARRRHGHMISRRASRAEIHLRLTLHNRPPVLGMALVVYALIPWVFWTVYAPRRCMHTTQMRMCEERTSWSYLCRSCEASQSMWLELPRLPNRVTLWHRPHSAAAAMPLYSRSVIVSQPPSSSGILYLSARIVHWNASARTERVQSIKVVYYNRITFGKAP